MPNWHDIHAEIREVGTTTDILRRKYLKRLHSLTKRNVIAYYSGWLQKPLPGVDMAISDADKSGFMTVVHRLDKSKGLDLLLHTPGGDMAATESIITYLRAIFGNDIRAIVPQIAMSGGSMIACACREILMGEHSNLGPFDPQVGGTPAQAIFADLQRAEAAMRADQSTAYVWQPILQRYNLGFFSQCAQAIKMADEVVTKNLMECMFAGEIDAADKAKAIVELLGSHNETKTHSRHIHVAQARGLGLKVVSLEDDEKLQDAVLSVHHAYILTFEQTGAFKIIENHQGTAKMGVMQQVLAVPTPGQ